MAAAVAALVAVTAASKAGEPAAPIGGPTGEMFAGAVVAQAQLQPLAPLTATIPPDADTLRLKPGVRASVTGPGQGTIMLRRGGGQIGGTFDCLCRDGSGSCTFKSSGGYLFCYKGESDSCKGSCGFDITVPGGQGNLLLQ